MVSKDQLIGYLRKEIPGISLTEDLSGSYMRLNGLDIRLHTNRLSQNREITGALLRLVPNGNMGIAKKAKEYGFVKVPYGLPILTKNIDLTDEGALEILGKYISDLGGLDKE
jgi:hypothetical protein